MKDQALVILWLTGLSILGIILLWNMLKVDEPKTNHQPGYICNSGIDKMTYDNNGLTTGYTCK